MKKIREHTMQPEIVIERRQVIATIPLSEHGTERPVVAAYRAIADYLDMRAGRDGEDDQVEFIFEGVTFRASCEMPTADQLEEMGRDPGLRDG